MKKTAVCLGLGCLLVMGGPAFATIVANDNVPAATLLLPYFDVDWQNCGGHGTGGGLNTLFSINNASASAILAHVTLWTDESIPTLDFDIYLTGYDIQTISMCDIFNGVLPQTASAGQDPHDTISPHGDCSQDINFASCTGILPLGPLGSALTAHIRAAHTGNFSAVLGKCAGFDHGDDIARGYLTVDTVNQCNIFFPIDTNYFTNIATTQNVLWGDYFYTDEVNNFASGESLVAIEACNNPAVGDAPNCPFAPGDYTFYGRYVGGTAVDQREALPTTFGSRYLNGGVFDGGTKLYVWRDSKTATGLTGFSCGTNASWYPLNQTEVVSFDEQEECTEICITPGPKVSPPIGDVITCFPLESGCYQVGDDPLIPSSTFGWLYLNLNTTVANVALYGPTAQAWVETSMSAAGRFSVGYDAVAFDNAFFTNGGAGVILAP